MKAIILGAVAVITMMMALAPEQGRADHLAVGRIYVSPIVGDGTGDNPFTALVCTFEGVTRCRNAVATEPTGGNRGRPSKAWALSYVEAADFTAIEANSQVFTVRLDESLDAVVPNVVKTRVRQAGALTQAELDGITTFRELLTALLQSHNGPLATIENQFPELFRGH